MRFKILRYREYDNDYVAFCENLNRDVIIDPFVTNAFEYDDRRTHIGDTYCDNNTSSEPYRDVFLPNTLDLIQEKVTK